MRICLDTNVLIWGVQGESHPTQRHMIRRTKQCLEFWEEAKVDIIVPAIAASEFLCHFDSDREREAYANILSRRFTIANYDARCGLIFAQIWNANASPSARKKLHEEHQVYKTVLKADCMIIATAIERRCDEICSNDSSSLVPMAQGFIEVKDVPLIGGASRPITADPDPGPLFAVPGRIIGDEEN